MANHYHIYKNNPTEGGTDGVLVSEGTGLTPVEIGPLNATNNEESSAIPLAIRCDTGYKTIGNVTITPVGTTKEKWALSTDGTTWQTYGSGITISTEVGATNKLFYVKAKATDDEVDPVNDTTVDIKVEAVIAAAS